LSEPNYAGNIIISLASLPEFLRNPILKKRLMEFFSMSPSDKIEIINNALQAGPTIPFDKFSKLFKTWLEILSTLSEDQRTIMFTTYIAEITENPQKIILFNLDGILEVYLSLNQGERDTISKSVKKIINSLDDDKKKRLLLVIPNRARLELGI
jgi:replication initiation and membrane attachment protein DnaB